MIAAFLIATLLGGRNPLLDRNFLIVFNGVLLLVLAMTIFPICCASARGGVELQNYLNVALMAYSRIRCRQRSNVESGHVC